MFKLFIRLLYPIHCYLCRKPLSDFDVPYLCQKDAEQLELLKGPLCSHCAHPISYDNKETCPDCARFEWSFHQVFSLFVYSGRVAQMLQAFKYEKKRYLIKSFHVLMTKMLREKEALKKNDLIVSVPLRVEKEKQRGFNQSTLVAKALAESLALPLYKKVLLRKGMENQAQASQKLSQRLKNIQGTIYSSKKKNQVSGKKVLLVDDVMTTGATVHECAKVLKEMGAKEVNVFTLARSVLK